MAVKVDETLDCKGLSCPMPILKLAQTMKKMKKGQTLELLATDPGSKPDVPAWCKSNGHEVVNIESSGADFVVTVRKGGAPPAPATASPAGAKKKTMVVFSGDLDKVLASFIIANGALAMGNEVTMFFTFWGLNALRKRGPQARGKGLLDWMFGWMMPTGAGKLTLSKMHMAGMGTAMMKHVMRSKKVDSLPALMQHAKDSGVKLVACAMSMDVMGIKREELIDGIEVGGVAYFLGESDEANMTLFV